MGVQGLGRGAAKISQRCDFFFLNFFQLQLYIYIYKKRIFFFFYVKDKMLQFRCYSTSQIDMPYKPYSGVTKFRRVAKLIWFAKFLGLFPLNFGPPLLQKFDTNYKNKHRKKIKKFKK